MKFKVKSGKIKDCLLVQKSGQWFYVTPKKGWLVAHADADGKVTGLAKECFRMFSIEELTAMTHAELDAEFNSTYEDYATSWNKDAKIEFLSDILGINENR